MTDGSPVSWIIFENAESTRLCSQQNCAKRIGNANDCLRIGLCAQAKGSMIGAWDLTKEYLRNRQLDGAPLSDLPVLLHRMAEMVASIEPASSLLYRAPTAIAEHDDHETRHLIAACSSYVLGNGKSSGAETIQLHGGMGIAADRTRSSCYSTLDSLRPRRTGESLLALWSNVAAPLARSALAQKARPAPAMTIARMPSSAFA